MESQCQCERADSADRESLRRKICPERGARVTHSPPKRGERPAENAIRPRKHGKNGGKSNARERQRAQGPQSEKLSAKRAEADGEDDNLHPLGWIGRCRHPLSDPFQCKHLRGGDEREEK